MDEYDYYILIAIIMVMGLCSGRADEVLVLGAVLYVLGIFAGFVPVPW